MALYPYIAGEMYEPRYDMMEMTEYLSVYGRNVKTDNIHFSFELLNRYDIPYSPRLRVWWGKYSRTGREDGYILLSDSMPYYKSKLSHITPVEEDVEELRNFCTKYKVLLLGTWSGIFDGHHIEEYLRNLLSFEELVDSCDIKDKLNRELVSECKTLHELEVVVRQHKIFDMYEGR